MRKTLVNKKSASLYMSGAPGTGKTACLMKALDELQVICKQYRIFLN